MRCVVELLRPPDVARRCLRQPPAATYDDVESQRRGRRSDRCVHCAGVRSSSPKGPEQVDLDSACSAMDHSCRSRNRPGAQSPSSSHRSGYKSADEAGASLRQPSRVRNCSRVRSTTPVGGSRASTALTRTGMSDSAHAAGLPRNANTSCTHTPYPRVHRDLPCRRRRTFTFPGRCRIRDCASRGPKARPRTTRAEHRVSQGSPRSSLLPRARSTPPTEPPTRGRRYPDSAGSNRARQDRCPPRSDHACRMRIARDIAGDDDRDPLTDITPAPDVPRSGRGLRWAPRQRPRPERRGTCTHRNEDRPCHDAIKGLSLQPCSNRVRPCEYRVVARSCQ